MLLNCHSYYSFHYGTMSLEMLIKAMQNRGHSSFALTDINSTAACIDLYRRLQQDPNLRAAYGADFRTASQQEFVALAIDREGFKQINEQLSLKLRKQEYSAAFLENCFVIYPLAKAPKTLKSNEFVGLSIAELKKLRFSKLPYPRKKLCFMHQVSFLNPKGYQSHKALKAIGDNLLFQKLSKEDLAPENAFLPRVEDIELLLKDFPEIRSNTLHIINSCHLDFDFQSNKNLQTFTGSRFSDYELLDKLCEEGMQYRFKQVDQATKDRVSMELDMIKKLGFASYFLINHDLVSYAQHKGYYYVGRGSGANSMVAYLLRITDVNPIELDLYFERFINPYRSSPPDFDIDFNWTDRDDITQYLFNKYGQDRTALLGTFVTMKHKGVYRELGKVFGLPADEIAALQRQVRQLNELAEPQRSIAFQNLDSVEQTIHSFAQVLAGFPHISSVHASGIIITDEPTAAYSATFMPPKGFATTQMDMHVAEDVGIYKFDILSQRGLGKIKGALEWIEKSGQEVPDIHDIRTFKDDPKLKKLLKTGDCVACFYIESPAMRGLLTKLKAEDYNRLVAASSIIRPGVAKSGMAFEYIERFQHPEKRETARKKLPELYEILEDTFGVMVYQEDVLKVAHYFAGLNLAEADVLRRGMNFKYRERNAFWKVKDKFYNNCMKKGYSEAIIDEIWTQIESFGNYAFAKGHSASYAVESFQALYLKAYYPLEYMTATLNNGGGFYRAELYLHEAKLHGAELELPCVNESDAGCKLIGKRLYVGLSFIRSLESRALKELLTERMLEGPFLSLRDFVKRSKVSLEQLCLLIRAGAFRFTGKSKKELLWDAHFLLGHQPPKPKALNLFEVEAREHKLPELWKHDLEDAYDEMELLGFCLSTSPFQLIDRTGLPQLKASELPKWIGRKVKIIGYLIHRKLTATLKKERMSFGTFIGLDGKWIDSVHFPQATKAYPFTGPGVYLLEGVVQDDYGFISLQVSYMKRIPNRNLMEEKVA